MRLLDTFVVRYQSTMRYIKLYEGDLSAIPPSEVVDLLVVSAFPDDYSPTPTSLIGALYRRGLSVESLARDKAVDLRSEVSCWLSKDVAHAHPDIGFRRVLCFESSRQATPPEAVGDVFRALMPFALGEPPIQSIAMPVLASGDQSFEPEVMLAALFDAGAHWLAHGLPIDVIKIVAYKPRDSSRLVAAFSAFRSRYTTRSATARPGQETSGSILMEERPRLPRGRTYDCFVSYSRADSVVVTSLIGDMRAAKPDLRVFQDQLEIKSGHAWQDEIDRALEDCRKVIAVYSPAYLQSKVCLEEFNMARLRHRESAGGVLLPVYLRTANLPLYMRSLHYLDCREADISRVREAASWLAVESSGS